MSNIVLSQGINSLPISNVVTGLSSMSLTQPEGTVISGNNSPHSDSGISVDGGGHAAMMNAAAMAKLHQSQSKEFVLPYPFCCYVLTGDFFFQHIK